MPFINCDGLQIHFEQTGSGHPMILVHGWGADSRSNWQETGWVDVLAAHRTVICIDIRGHGRSDKPYALAPYSYAALCDDVIAVMDTLNIQSADYMGYSMGAFMGAYLLGHHPQRFTAMVLGGIGDESEASAAQGKAIATALRAPSQSDANNPAGQAVRRFVEANPNNDLEALAYSAEQMWPQGYPRQLAGTELGAANFPVLIVNGADDHPYVDSADEFAAALANARHVQIPATDHLSVVPDDRFKQAVLEFLTSAAR